MAKVATDFMKRHKWTFKTPSSELAQYTEEISKSLKDDRKVRSNAKTRFRVLGLTKEQVEVLIPIRPTEKREEGRDTVDKIAQEIRSWFDDSLFCFFSSWWQAHRAEPKFFNQPHHGKILIQVSRLADVAIRSQFVAARDVLIQLGGAED